MAVQHHSVQCFSLFSVAIIFLICVSSITSSSAPIIDADDCIQRNLSGNQGILNLTHSVDKPKLTCYQFQIYDVVTPIFFGFIAELGKQNVSKISVYNVNSTGGLGVVSKRTFSNTDADSESTNYVAVGFGRNTTEEVVRVVVVTSKPIPSDQHLVVANYTNADCKLSYPSLPSDIQTPDYELGASAKNKFSCIITVDKIRADPLYATTIAFTQFQFTAPAGLQVNSGTSAPVVAKYDGTDLPPDTIVQDTLVLHMYINPANSDTFSLSKALSTEGCTRNVLINSTGRSVRSPGFYTGQYSDNLNCKIILHSEDKKRLQLNLTHIGLARDADRVEVIDGGASRSVETKLISYLSAMDDYKHRDAAMVSSGPIVMIRFTTDEMETAKGFSFIVSEIDMGGRYFTPSSIHFAPDQAQADSADLVMQADRDTMVEFAPDTSGGIVMSPTSTLQCYDGDSTSSPLVASYRSDILMFPAYSTNHKMLCVAKGFNAGNVFNATARSVTNGLTKFSHSVSDKYYMDLPVGEAGEAKSQYNWIIQPDQSNYAVIELIIYQFAVPKSTTIFNLRIQSMMNTIYSTITADTRLPYIVRADRASGLRMSVDVTPPPQPSGTSSEEEEEEEEEAAAFSISAAYTLDTTTTSITQSSGTLMSPHYPQGTPQNTVKTWLFTLPSNKSLQLSFSSLFELSNGSSLTVSLPGDNVTYYSQTSGPTLTAPSDLIINNTGVSEPMTVSVDLLTDSQSKVTGVKIDYILLDAGYRSILGKSTQEIFTPVKLDSTFVASWVLYATKKDSKGFLQRVSGTVDFKPSNSTMLELRDGSNANSPLMTSGSFPKAKGTLSAFTFTTSSNSLYVSYRFVKKGNATGSPLAISAMIDVCTNSSQCMLLSNQTVCMPKYWKCDGIYQCMDGKDELGCTAPASSTSAPLSSTTAEPPVPKKGAKWWVVVLCILGGIVIGVVASVIATMILRRRGRGYNRLSELMTPVPT